MSVFISALAPVLLIIIIGYIASYKLNIDTKTLSSLAISVLVPALIADSLSNSQVSLKSATGIVFGFLIIALILYILVLILSKILSFSPSLKKTLIATTLFGNNGNLGLPFITFALGEEALERAIIHLITGASVMALFLPALLKGEGINKGIKLTLKMPLLWATLAGIILKITSFNFPFRLDYGIKILGEAAIPMALLLLGIQLAKGGKGWGKKEVLASVLRLFIAPLIAIFVGNLLQLQGVNFQVLVLQSSMPTAVNTYVWVNEFGGDAALTTRIIILSTILSFFTLSIVLLVVTN